MKVKLSKEREREKSARKALGFHIQLGFKAIAHESISRANYLITKTSRVLYLVFGKEKQTGEDRGFFCLLFPVFCFLFSLYIRTDRDVLYYKREFVVRWGKTLDCVTRCAFCSLVVSIVCLSLSLRVCTSRESERECVLFLVFFSFQSRF